MAKRLRDTETWNKKWFRLLPLEYKCFWFYILDNCNIIGIWDVDFDLASFQIGQPIDPAKAREFFGEQMMEFDGGTKWFLLDFIKFQYGEELKPSSPIHKKVIDLLKGTKFDNNTLYDTVHDTLLYRVQIKEEREEEEKREGKEKYADSVFLKKSEYEKLVKKIGEEKTKKCIEKLDAYKDSRGKKYKSDYKAILNWVIDEINKNNVPVKTGADKYPTYYDEGIARKLSPPEWMEYKKKLIGLGWTENNAPGGTVWNKPKS